MQEIPTPPTAPTPQGPVVIQIPGPGQNADPHMVYEGYRNQRSELRNQLDRLESQREELADQLKDPMVSGPMASEASRTGLEQRITAIDLRIAELDKAIAQADASVASAAAAPGAIVPDPPQIERGPPEEFVVLAVLFMFIVILPLTIAYARRIWRRGAAVVSAIPKEIYDRFARVDQSLDAIAIEVERIGEGQRFLTRMYTERGLGAGAGPAERVESKLREPDRLR